jgi:hypothetical protein
MDSDTEECIGCQDRFDTETMYDCNETGKVCSSCRDSDTFECQECSELFMLGVAIQIEGEEDMCPKCAGKFIAAAIDAE